MEDMQNEFFNELKKIQNESTNIMLSKAKNYDNLNSIFTDLTYDVIYSVMELIDGYRNPALSYKIIEKKSEEWINSTRDLHNLCEEYLKCTNI